MSDDVGDDNNSIEKINIPGDRIPVYPENYTIIKAEKDYSILYSNIFLTITTLYLISMLARIALYTSK